MSIAEARTVADAVLYEGYLLYPYRATSGKNLMRWQFGVLGPHGAEAAGLGEDSQLELQCLVRTGPIDTPADPEAELTFHVRFLQVQHRRPQRLHDGGRAQHLLGRAPLHQVADQPAPSGGESVGRGRPEQGEAQGSARVPLSSDEVRGSTLKWVRRWGRRGWRPTGRGCSDWRE